MTLPVEVRTVLLCVIVPAPVTVVVKEVRGRTLLFPHFTLQSDSGPIDIRAESAELRSNAGSGVLTVILKDAQVEIRNQHASVPGYSEREIRVNPEAGHDSSPAHMALRDIPGAKHEQYDVIHSTEQRMAAQAGFQRSSLDLMFKPLKTKP